MERNHEKLNAKRRIRTADIAEAERTNPDRDAAEIKLRKYARQKKRPCEILAMDPQYLFWAFAADMLRGWSWEETFELLHKARHIKPPKRRPGDWVFAMKFNSENELMNIKLVKKTEVPRGYVFAKHLDMSVVSISRRKGPGKRLIESFTRIFFDGKDPRKWELIEFFKDDHHFDLACREKHFPSIPRLERQQKLIEGASQ